MCLYAGFQIFFWSYYKTMVLKAKFSCRQYKYMKNNHIALLLLQTFNINFWIFSKTIFIFYKTITLIFETIFIFYKTIIYEFLFIFSIFEKVKRLLRYLYNQLKASISNCSYGKTYFLKIFCFNKGGGFFKYVPPAREGCLLTTQPKKVRYLGISRA